MTHEELAELKAFFALDPDDERRLRALEPAIERHADGIVEELYRFLRSSRSTTELLRDDAAVAHLARTQREYLLRLFSGAYDASYAAHRLRVGATHHRIGLAPEWYLGAYRRYLDLLVERVVAPDPETLGALRSLFKVVFFDIALALEAYAAAEGEARARREAFIRELSTPVIELEPRILLVPLVGAIDDGRGELFMQTVLSKVTERSARAVIVDIAGVPLIDTETADRLLRTAAAVRLLGSEAIVTGLRPEVARTLVELGVDVGTLATCLSLADGIAAARALLR